MMDQYQGDPNISLPIPHSSTSSSSANGHANTTIPITPTPTSASTTRYPMDPANFPGGPRSLSSISLHALCLGITLSTCTILAISLALSGHRIWRLPQFIASLSLFHFLEFYTTARWNTPKVSVASYLLTANGTEYLTAHVAAALEIVVTTLFLPSWQAKWCNAFTVSLGLVFVVVGQVTRSTAMAQAGVSFNHLPAKRKTSDHVLVTHGVYAWSRHPSYFGYFFFAIGTQVVVGNKVCAIVYVVALWLFFKDRIATEEVNLIRFFDQDYVRYRERTGTGIPFIR